MLRTISGPSADPGVATDDDDTVAAPLGHRQLRTLPDSERQEAPGHDATAVDADDAGGRACIEVEERAGRCCARPTDRLVSRASTHDASLPWSIRDT